MTEEEIADITLAEAWVGENGFDSDYNNINSIEANGELVNAFLAGLKAGIGKLRYCCTCKKWKECKVESMYGICADWEIKE